MKWMDDVRITTDKYESQGVKKGAIGTIILSEIRSNTFEVIFDDDIYVKQHGSVIYLEVYVGDMELVRDAGFTDEVILEDLPKKDPTWWCKVEDGYILNIRGDRKNKIPYDYES